MVTWTVNNKNNPKLVGNPCNTNALTCMKNAPSIPKENFTCLTRLDQNRAKSQVLCRLIQTPIAHITKPHI